MHYLLLTTVAILLWASLATLASSLSHLPPFYILSLSLLIGGALSIPQWRSWQFNFKLLTVGVVGIFGYHFLLFMALRLAPTVSANLINYLWPLLILLFTPLFFNEFKLTKLHIIGVLISFIGAAMLVIGGGAGNSEQAWSFDYLLGYSLALMAAVTWSCYSLATKKMAKFSSATVGLFCLLSGLLSLIAHNIFEPSVEITAEQLMMITLLGLGPLGIAFYCWDSAVKKGDPRVIATLSYLTPLISTLLLTYVNDLPMSENIIFAMLAIIFGALIANVTSLFKR